MDIDGVYGCDKSPEKERGQNSVGLLSVSNTQQQALCHQTLKSKNHM